MKFTLVFLVICGLVQHLFPQSYPDSYLLQGENKYLSKSNSANPLSNSITDIITVGDTIWLGTSRGVSLSTDNGISWTNFYGRSDFGTDNVSAIGYHNGIFWCATARSFEVGGGDEQPGGTGLKFTTNLGETWFNIPQPVDLQTDTVEQYGINQIRALPITVVINNLTYDIAFTTNTIWIASFAGELRKARIDSLLANQNYKFIRVVLPPDNLNSISPNEVLDFCLSPSGGRFCSSGNLNHRVFSVTTDLSGTLYVGTANGINKSTDGGISWRKFNAQNQQLPISGNFITALAYNNFSNTVWASTWKAEDQNEFYGVSSSSNGGQSWQTFLTDERPHNFGFKNFDVMVATDNGVFRSSDNGLTWLLPNSIVDQESDAALRTKIFYDADSYSNNVWLGSGDGLVKLVETPGKMWEGNWKIYFASKPLAANDETYCYPNPFNPRQEELKIKYSTGGQQKDVTIQIFDFGFNYIRTVIQNAPRERDLEGPPDFWDGRDDNGNYVPNGVYFYRVKTGDDAVFGKILVMQ